MRKFCIATIVVIEAIAAAWVATTPRKNAEAQVAEESARKDERVFMLNVLWFKEDGGAEKYAEYIAAAAPFVEKLGGKTNGSFVPEAGIIGEFDADLFFVVEWPSEAAFLALVQDPEYRKISHLREEAVRDSLLIRCRAAQ